MNLTGLSVHRIVCHRLNGFKTLPRLMQTETSPLKCYWVTMRAYASYLFAHLFFTLRKILFFYVSLKKLILIQ